MKSLTTQSSTESLAKLFLSKVKMNGASRWKKITAHALFNATTTPRNESTPRPPPKLSAAALKGRIQDLFPPGFEGSSQSIRRPYAYAPFQLHDILARNRAENEHVDQTIVKSIFYGKQTKSAALHEFIVVQIEDLTIPGLINYIALDRNQETATAAPRAIPQVSAVSSNTTAFDTFRVSYDGDPNFLKECQLTPYNKLEQIHFPADKPLLLLDFVAFVRHLSDEHPTYNVVGTNCYWFTGLIWECVRKMYPEATHEIHWAGKRGKIAFARSVPNPIQVWNESRVFQSIIAGQDRPTPGEWEDVDMSEFDAENLALGEAEAIEANSAHR